MRENRLLLSLFILALLLTLFEPGRVPLFEPDEGRYAEIPREMLATRDFVTPRLNGVLYFEKPPLYYWAVAASFRLFGQTEFAARLPGKLASVAMSLLTFAFARRRWGDRTGLVAGLIASTSLLVFVLARIALIDACLSLALSAAVFAFAAFAEADAASDAPRARWCLYGFHVACAAAVMLKGLVGIALPGAAILVFTLLTRRFRTLARVFSLGPLLVFLALAVPWHVVMARRHPDFLSFYFVHEHFDRFARNEHRREGPIVYFIPVVLAGFLPWTGFFGRLKETFPTRLSAVRDRPTEAFLWIWSILVLVFFSLSRSKLIPYVEPVWPALAMLLAVGLERGHAAGASFSFERRASAVLFGALLVAGVAWGLGAGYLDHFGTRGLGLAALAALLAGFLLNASPGLVRGAPASRRDALPLVAAPWLVFLLALLLVLPGAARWVTPWPIVSTVVQELRPNDLLLQRGHYLEVLPFYARRLTPVTALGWSELDFGRSHLGAEPLFPTDAEFVSKWNGLRRVLVVVHRDRLRDFFDPTLALAPARELARETSGKHLLLTNR